MFHRAILQHTYNKAKGLHWWTVNMGEIMSDVMKKTYHNRSIEATCRPESRRTYVCGIQLMAALGRPLSINTIYIFNRGFKVWRVSFRICSFLFNWWGVSSCWKWIVNRKIFRSVSTFRTRKSKYFRLHCGNTSNDLYHQCVVLCECDHRTIYLSRVSFSVRETPNDISMVSGTNH